MGVHPRALDVYDQLLLAETGVNYHAIAGAVGRVGTAPGCHSPLLIVLTRLIRSGRVRNVLELGSGVTTFYMAAACETAGARLLTMENDSHWYTAYHSASRDVGIRLPPTYVCDPTLRATGGPFDLILADSASDEHRLDTLAANVHLAAPDALIMIDDCDQPQMWSDVKAWWGAVPTFLSWSRRIACVGDVSKLAGIVDLEDAEAS